MSGKKKMMVLTLLCTLLLMIGYETHAMYGSSLGETVGTIKSARFDPIGEWQIDVADLYPRTEPFTVLTLDLNGASHSDVDLHYMLEISPEGDLFTGKTSFSLQIDELNECTMIRDDERITFHLDENSYDALEIQLLWPTKPSGDPVTDAWFKGKVGTINVEVTAVQD